MGNIETESALTEPTAQRALENGVCQQARFNADGTELIRIGSNAAYQLREPMIVRIVRDDPDATEDVRKHVAVARRMYVCVYVRAGCVPPARAKTFLPTEASSRRKPASRIKAASC